MIDDRKALEAERDELLEFRAKLRRKQEAIRKALSAALNVLNEPLEKENTDATSKPPEGTEDTHRG